MKRDWDCIRAILVALEENGDATSFIEPSDIAAFDAETVAYNTKLLIEAGLAEGLIKQSRGLFCVVRSMTWEGHELLDKMRSEKLWNQIKKTAREKGVSLSFEAVKALGTYALTRLLSGQ